MKQGLAESAAVVLLDLPPVLESGRLTLGLSALISGHFTLILLLRVVALL